MSQSYDFSDIAPFGPERFSQKMQLLVNEPGFEHAVRYVLPDVDYPDFVNKLLQIPDQDAFQTQVMWPFLELLANRTSTGITVGGLEHLEPGRAYTFVTNHRDIVLDASFLNLCFLRAGLPTSEVAIGNNLLVYDWIDDLVRLNKSFIVKRNLRLTKALEAARQLSAYIHHAVIDKHQSVWIAQREGRAKDSNDVTQEAVIKMMGLEGGGDTFHNISSLNIVPVAISYELDPNDYLKARELLLKRIDPHFKKTQHDDLFSMETGLLQPKGHIHFEIAPCINDEISDMAGLDRIELVKGVCHVIDCHIHAGYRLYPVNYIASDLLHQTDRYSSNYTESELQSFRQRLDEIPAKTGLPDLSELDREFMRQTVLTMYSNPLKNKLRTEHECDFPC